MPQATVALEGSDELADMPAIGASGNTFWGAWQQGAEALPTRVIKAASF